MAEETQNLSFTEYQKQAASTAIYPKRYEIIYPGMGLSNEAGECLGKIKKVLRDKDGIFSQEDKEAIAGEALDTVWYCAALLSDLGIDFGEYAQKNLDKLKSRMERGKIQGSGDNR